MKDYQKILDKLPSAEYRLIEQQWGQSPETVYSQVADAWNGLEIGRRIFVLTRKVYGFKRLVTFLREQGIDAEIVGKHGATDLRMLEILKNDSHVLNPVESERIVHFSFRDRSYSVDVGQAIFSKKGLDEGTRFLLESVLEDVPSLNGKKVGDLGAGWGAISLILATEFPTAQIIAFENEPGSVAACQKNTNAFKNIELVDTDVTEPVAMRAYHKTFDVLVSNFSFHVTTEARDRFFQNVRDLLKPRGRLFIVAEGRFVARCEQAAKKVLTIVQKRSHERYTVFSCEAIQRRLRM